MDYDSNDVNRSTVTYPRISAGVGGIGRYTLFMQTATPGVFSSVTSTPNTTDKTKVKNNEKFMLGKIYYSNRGSDLGALNASDTTNSWMDQQTNLVDLKYSFNIANGELTAREPIFLVGTLTDDGYFRLADTWWTQTPVEADDGTVYIYIGQVYNDSQPYRCTLDLNNPAIWYKDDGWKEVVQYAAKTETAVSANHAGSANYATTASNAGYAGSAGAATTAGNAVLAGTASWAILSGTANYATLASCANNAVTAGGAITASRAFYSTSSGYVTTAQNAVTAGNAKLAGTASWAVTAGRAIHAASATYVATAANAVTAGYASMANEILGNHSTLNNITLAANTTADYVWFNLFPDATSGASADYAYPITSYRFGNKQAGWAGVELKADFFSGKASCAGWATSAGWASSANFAMTASRALSAGSAGYAMTASAAVKAGCAAHAVTAGRALYANTANNAVTAGRAISSASAAYTTTAGNAVLAGTANFAIRTAKLGVLGNNYKDTEGSHSLGSSWLLGGTQVAKPWEFFLQPTSATYLASGSTTAAMITEAANIQLVISQATANNASYFNLAVDGNMKAFEFIGRSSSSNFAASATEARHAASANYALKSNSAAYAVTAGRALSAGSATFATSATEARHAASANYAMTASNALNAKTAENSGSATYAAQSTTAGNAGTAGKADAANITTTNNAVAIYTNTTGGFGTIPTKAGAFYATAANVKAVFGTLPVGYGGTGKTTLVDGANTFINSLTSGTSTPVDNDYYVAQWVNGGSNTAIYVRRTHSALWGYIQNKIGSAAYVKSVAGKSGPTVTLNKLTVGHKEYNGSADVEIKAADLDLAKSMTFLGKTTTPIQDGSTTATVSILVNNTPTNHTAENGDVVIYDGEEFIYSSTANAWQSLGLASSYALHNHTHGNISSGGKISTTAPIATGSSLIIGTSTTDLARSSIEFDATKTGYALTQAGTWAQFNNYSLPNASTTQKGGVKIGSNLSISNDAVLSLTGQNVIDALGYNPAESGGSSGIEYIVGTQSVQTSAWTGATTESSLETGKVIAYKIPQASSAGAAVSLSLALAGGGTAAKWVLLNGGTALTTQYPANTVVILAYDGSAWRIADYDSNTDTFVRQQLQDDTDNTNRPILLAVRDSTDSTTSVTGIAYRNNTIYANPSTGKITATGFIGAIEGQASCAVYAATAGWATSAGYAASAAQATHAATAIWATSAAYAASAAQATHAASAAYSLNAASATWAISAGSAGYAASAAQATHAASAAYALSAASAGYAASAAQATHAASAQYALSAGSAGYAASAAQATHAASAAYAAVSGKLGTTNVGTYLKPIFLASGSATATAGTTIPFIVGTGTTAGTWLGTLTGLTAYYDGLLILYKPSVAGASGGVTLKLNELEAKTVYLLNTTKVTTHFPVNQPILLTYSASQNNGCWMVVTNYDSVDYRLRVYRQTTGYNADYPLLVSRTEAASIGTAGTDSSTGYVYGVMWNDTTKVPTLNPSTGLMKVPGGINATLNGKASCAGYAASAGSITPAGTAAQFRRGDNTWSDTISGGTLKITANSNTVTIGSANASFCHFSNSANIPFYFNNSIDMAQGKTIGQAGSQYRPYQIYLGRNTTADSSALNAATPLIEFSNSDRSQYCQMQYTDYNSQGGSDSIHFVSNQTDFRVYAPKVFGAVWNDYAEYRQSDELEPGRCIIENGDGTLSRSTERLQRGCEIVSDTYGFAIGQTDICQTPTAASGRVLAYLLEDNDYAKSYIGWPVCSGPNGTVSIMTEEEEEKYPSRIIGTISEIPNYEIWEAGQDGKVKIEVNGRIWIRVR